MSLKEEEEEKKKNTHAQKDQVKDVNLLALYHSYYY